MATAHIVSGTARAVRLVLAVAALAGLAFVAAPADAARERPLEVQAEDVSAKVGEKATLTATVKVKDGHQFLSVYRHRLGRLSSADDGVEFGDRSTLGTVDKDGDVVFTLDVTPTKPGPHPVNGVFRIGYHNGKGEMNMVSMPLMITVTGTE
jgi:uncharacterized protein (DUF58 family)